MQMKENLGVIESALRAIAGTAMIIFALFGDKWDLANYAIVGVTVIGTILLLTGIQRTCPLYHMLGLSTY